MLRSLHTAALGMSAQQKSVDNISNNLANANTTGYKESKVVFQDLLYQNVQAPAQGDPGEGAPPATLQLGHGARAVATVRNHTQGGLKETGNELDLAVNGDGFFQVRQPDGSLAFSRDGTFTLGPEGNIVTQNGLQLEPPIAVPPDAISINVHQNGVVSARLQGEVQPIELGQLELARFANPAGLRSKGGNLYAQTEASGQPVIGVPGQNGLGVVQQGYLESANVDVVKEMVSLIEAQRAYEINSKMVTTSESMLQVANNLKR